MEKSESFEAKLLRMLVGYTHVALTEQLALTRLGKPFHTATKEEKNKVQADLMQDVLTVARSASATMLTQMLQTVQPPTDFGKVN